MSKMIRPITVRAASLTLTGSLANVVGTVSTDAANVTSGAVRVGSAQFVRLVCTYTRDAGSTSGAPAFAVDVSMDTDDTAAASVANWVPAQLLDAASFSAGAIDAYPEVVAIKPSATGATTRGTPPWDVRGAHWMRVRVKDVDAALPGAVASLAFGGET